MLYDSKVKSRQLKTSSWTLGETLIAIYHFLSFKRYYKELWYFLLHFGDVYTVKTKKYNVKYNCLTYNSRYVCLGKHKHRLFVLHVEPVEERLRKTKKKTVNLPADGLVCLCRSQRAISIKLRQFHNLSQPSNPLYSGVSVQQQHTSPFCHLNPTWKLFILVFLPWSFIPSPAVRSLTCWDADEQVGQGGVVGVDVVQRLGPDHHTGEGHMLCMDRWVCIRLTQTNMRSLLEREAWLSRDINIRCFHVLTASGKKISRHK